MAYTLTNIQDDIKSYTEVDDTVFTTAILNTIIKNAENRIYRESDSDDNRFYATSNLQSGSRYVTIPSDLRAIRYVQLKDRSNNQTFLEKKETSYMATFYDTPGTASQVTYKLQIRSTGGTFSFNGRGGELNSPMDSYMIVEEIAV